MKKYTTYIFDLDGTLTDTVNVWLGIFKDGLTHFNVVPPDDKTLSGHTHDWREMLKLGLHEEQLQDFIAFAHGAANERLPKAPLHTGAYEMLERLKNADKRIAIFSTLDRPIFEPAMKFRSLDTIAEVAVAGTDVSHRKPHPAGILEALKQLRIPEEAYSQAVYIGDKDTDIQAAHNAGIDAILYYPAAHQVLYPLGELKKHKPEYIISDWEDLF